MSKVHNSVSSFFKSTTPSLVGKMETEPGSSIVFNSSGFDILKAVTNVTFLLESEETLTNSEVVE